MTVAADPAPAGGARALVEAAAQTGWRLPTPTRALLADLEARLALRPRTRLGHLAPTGGPLRRLLAADPRVRLTGFRSDLDASSLHARLAGHGPFDLLVVVTPDPVDLRRLADVLFHLRRGGALALWFPSPAARSAGPAPRPADEAVTPPQRFVRDLQAHLSASPPEQTTGQPAMGAVDRLRLERATRRLVLGPRHLLVLAQVHALAKLRDDEVDTVLEIRGGRAGRVLERLPGEPGFTARCRVRESAPVSTVPGGVPMPASYDVPPVSLREYADVVCRPQQIAVQRHLLLPDSYRKPRAPRLQHHATEEVAERFARPRNREPAEPLAGSYFHLDIEWPGHFGHAVTEQLSRLWALPAARAAHPDLKVLLSRRRARPALTGFEREIFGAAGVEEQDVVLFDRPVRVERLLAATPMYATPDYAHPALVRLWEQVGDRLAAGATPGTGPRRVFCTRRGPRRPCHNAAEVEERFAAAGFAVLHPEDLPLGQQVQLFREAEVVGGFAGSALLGTLFARRPGHVVVVSSESYTARNEWSIAALLGHRLDVVWCRPDVAQPAGGWDATAFGSGFTFDAAREGVFLDQVLATL